jgi:hypothetical protein
VLVSESDIPLYDPLTLHQQLMAETKSHQVASQPLPHLRVRCTALELAHGGECEQQMESNFDCRC